MSNRNEDKIQESERITAHQVSSGSKSRRITSNGRGPSTASYSAGRSRVAGAKRPYWHIDTGGDDATPDGGMMERQRPEHRITNYVGVPSVDRAAAKVEKLGGKICMEKTAVPEMGYFRRLPRHGEQHLCSLGTGREGEIVVLKAIVRSS